MFTDNLNRQDDHAPTQNPKPFGRAHRRNANRQDGHPSTGKLRLVLLKLELIKLARVKAIWAFVAICVIVNICFVFANSKRDVISYYNAGMRIAGTEFSDDFLAAARTAKKPADLWPALLYDNFMTDAETGAAYAPFAFDGVRGDALKDAIRTSEVAIAPLAEKLLLAKYERLKPVIEEKIARGDGKSVYFGSYTNEINDAVIVNLGKLLLCENGILFMLLMFLSLGFEWSNRTEHVVYASKRGRRIITTKMCAGLIAGSAAFLIIYIISYSVNFLVNDYSLVWNENISAMYHTVYMPLYGHIPFITWESMSVGSYAVGHVLASYLNALVLACFAAVIGLAVRNPFAAFCIAAGLILVHFFAILHSFTEHFFYYLLLAPPFTQMFFNQYWFSEGVSLMLVPHFEIWYPLICLAVLAPLLLLFVKMFRRKGIV